MCNCSKNNTVPAATPKSTLEVVVDTAKKTGAAVKNLWEKSASSRSERVHRVKR